MEELQLSLTPARVDHRNAGVMLANWRIGQMLNALVVNTQPNGSVLLSVGGKQFVATTDIPVQPGTHINLEVKQLGREIFLKLVGPGASTDAGFAVRLPAAGQTPASTGMAGLLTQLAASGGRLPSPELAAVARDLLGRGLKADQLSPGALQRAIRDSGLFTEALLAAGAQGAASQSPKASLSAMQQLALAMAQGMEPDDPDVQPLLMFSERAAASINGVVNQQLASVPHDDGPPRWVVTLPVEVGGTFHDIHLTIQRDATTDDPTEAPPWRVSVRLDLPRLGGVDVTVMLRGGVVSVGFVCEQPATSRWLGRSFNQLTRSLERQELRVERLDTEVVPAASANRGSDAPGHIEVTV